VPALAQDIPDENAGTEQKPNTNATKEIMKATQYLWIVPVGCLVALTACKATPKFTNRPSFLSTYNHIRKVDDTTWRYVAPPLLAQSHKFVVSPVKVLFDQYDGKPITAEQRQRTSDFMRQAIVTALSDRYPIVTETGPDVAEIRIALTDAYRTGGKLGLCVEGEVLDNSNTQVAAFAKTELTELYSPRWEDKDSAKKMVEAWAMRLRSAIDEAHAKF
jgi:hypothetical protein